MTIVLKPLEFMIVAKVAQVDEDGEIIDTHNITRDDGSPLVLTGMKSLREFVDGFEGTLLEVAGRLEERLAAASADSNGGGENLEPPLPRPERRRQERASRKKTKS